MYNFVMDPAIGPFSRVRRRIQEEKEQMSENKSQSNGKAHVE